MKDQIGQPAEFDENLIGADDPAPVANSRRGGNDAGKLVISKEAPLRIVSIVTGGNRRVTVSVVDKEAWFMVPADQLRARWSSIAVRGVSGRVMVYDGTGAMLARFPDMKQANQGFKEAGILDNVTAWLKADAAKKAAQEKQARERLAAQKAG